MHWTIEALQYAGGGIFIALAYANLHAWLRHRQRGVPFLALALGSIGSVSLLDRLAAATGYRVQAITNASVVLFLLSGYALFRFRDAYVPLDRRVRRAVEAAMVALVVASAWIRLPSGPRPEYSGAQILVLVAVILLWAGCSIEPTIHFWRASRGSRGVQRSRLRALAFGYSALVAIVLVLSTAAPAGRYPWVTVTAYVLGMVVAPFIYASFAPPAWLRRAWRQQEEEALLRATRGLTRFSTDPAQPAARGLEWATRLLGADAGFITDGAGEPLVTLGLGDDDARSIAAGLPPGGGSRVSSLGDGRHAVVVPTRAFDTDSLVVVSGPFTPLFGSDEVSRLGQLAEVVGSAMERVRLSRAFAGEKARSDALLRTMSDVGEGVVITENARVVDANQAFLDLVGYTLQELAALESPLADLAPPDERPSVLRRYWERLGDGPTADHYETALIRKDGTRIHVEVAVKVALNEGDARTVSVIRDITERKRAEEAIRRSEEQLAEAQRLAHLGSWDWNVERNTLTWSTELYRIFGVDAEGFTPTYEAYIDRIHPDDREHVADTIGRALVDGRAFSFDHRIVAAGGSARTLHCRGQVELNAHGEPLRLFGTAQDVTERRRIEDAVRRAYEREHAAAERLRALDAMKNSFLTAVSHELRTPLTAVLGFAKTLERHDVRLSAEDQRMFLQRLAANAEKLDRLLSDLLDVDRLSRGLLSPVRRPVDIGRIVRQVVSESSLLQDRPVHVDVPDLAVELDGAKVERILENLVANAVRHTPAGTPIWVRAWPDREGVLLAVEDAGNGVPVELREAVFEPFRQGSDVANHSPGVGIGLSLVFRFAELHGGRAWVEDRPGGGASFRVYLPGRRADTTTLAPASAAG